MRYKDNKTGMIIIEWKTMPAQKVFGVLSMPNWDMLVGVGENGALAVICWAEDEPEKLKKQIEKVIEENYIIID
jgi:hypothetical protein